MSTSSFLLLVVCIFPFSLSNSWYCNRNNLPWNWNAQLIEDCDILKDQVTIHLDRWLKDRLTCLETLTVRLGNHQKDIDRPGGGYQRVVTFDNPLPLNQRCESMQVFISSRICFNKKCFILQTTF